MKSKLGHVYLYVSDLEKSFDFYKKFLEYLEYKEIGKYEWGFAFINEGASLWFERTPKDGLEAGYNRRRTGLNHLAFRVNSKEEVDKFGEEFLGKNNITTMYESPKEFPEYGGNYYAVYFTDPDGIKLEVAYYD